MAEIEKRLAIMEKKEEDRQAEAVMKESYEKRLNILIHGIEENHRSAWESRPETLESIHQFMREGLNIEDPSRFAFVDYRRLPQRPLYKNAQKVDQPVIITLTSAADKQIIFSHLKNLKPNNEARKLKNFKAQYILYNTTFTKAISMKKKKTTDAIFKICPAAEKVDALESGTSHYVLYVNSEKVNIISDESQSDTTSDSSDNEA